MDTIYIVTFHDLHNQISNALYFHETLELAGQDADRLNEVYAGNDRYEFTVEEMSA